MRGISRAWGLLLCMFAASHLTSHTSQHSSSSLLLTSRPSSLSLLTGAAARTLSDVLDRDTQPVAAAAAAVQAGSVDAPAAGATSSTGSTVLCAVKTCQVVPASVAACQCVTRASLAAGAPQCCPFMGPAPPYYAGDKEALLRGLEGKNQGWSDYLYFGWKRDVPLCNSTNAAGGFWAGVDCLDPVWRPGVVSKMPLDAACVKCLRLDSPAGFRGMVGLHQYRGCKLPNLHWNRQPFFDRTAKGLSGTIPASWSGMKELQTLTLAGNALEGTFPAALKSLTKLNYLSIDNNIKLSGHLPRFWQTRVFNMVYTTGISMATGIPKTEGPTNYGRGGVKLYTGAGPLWRTNIINWEGLGNNSALNPDPQPNPDPCVADP